MTPPGRRTLVLAGLTAALAVVCALLLPFAPVAVNRPTVSWPREPARPESTLLTLTAYRPLGLDVRFSCEVARLAETTDTGVVVATALTDVGLTVRVVDGRLAVDAAGQVLLEEPLPAEPCAYRIGGTSAGLPSHAGPPPDPADPAPPDPAAFAAPGNAELVVSRDGRDLVRTPTEQLPDVDVLVTALSRVPPGELSVELRVDDEFTSSPTPRKRALTALLVLAVLATAVLLVRIDRTADRPPRPPWRLRLRAVDLVVPAVLVVWTFVAPATDDDGYFAAQATNAVLTGDVGNYYRFYDQSFTPFTWPYQALGAWQQLVGHAPVPQRIPALVCGLLTWLVLRRFVAAAGVPATARRPAPAVLGVVFLAWWLPFGMGVRPEPLVALCGAAAMLAVLLAARRRRLAYAWLACAVAGLGFTAHPAGFTLVAALLAGLPLLRPLLHVPADRAATALRALAVASGGMVAPLLGFADGALRDFRRGQALALSVLDQQGWADELERYVFLLGQWSMGNFAKRAAVLACLVALGWFAVLAVTAWARRVAVPVPLRLAAATTALGLAALAFTPSKWTHHFGALAGVGAAFLALFLVLAVPLTREVLGGQRLPLGVLVAVAGTFLVVVVLGWRGPNAWPHAWLDGVRTPNAPPAVRNVALHDPLLWVLALVGVTLALTAAGRARYGWRPAALRAVPVVVVASLAAGVGYAVGTFGTAAARGVPPGSVWAQALADPAGTDCGAAGAVRVLDPFTAQPLPAADLPAPPPPEGFLPPGHNPADPPPGAVDAVWDSETVRGTGQMSTGWYQLPEGTVTLLAAGALTEAGTLTAVYGRRSGTSVVPVGTEALTDGARSPAWRTFVLAPPDGTDVVRLDAADASGAPDGWLAFTAPAAARPVVLADLLPIDAPVALGWQLAFGYPCQRQPAVVDGVTEPAAFAVLRGDRALAGLTGLGWQAADGGVSGQVVRTQSVLQLATVGPGDPAVQVYAFATDLRRAAYTLTTERRTTWGWG